MGKIIMLRHGQSQWNLENRFTGWTDVELSASGREEARKAGELMLKAGLKPEFCFTSYLRRAVHTLQTALEVMGRDWVPVVKDWHLNERHYGALQGLNKAATAEKYGDEQVHIWRRSYDVRPPQLEKGDPRCPEADERYAALTADELTLGESLKDTIERVRPCWEEEIVPRIRLYDTVLISAHGNSLRALVMMLLHMSPDEIMGEEIPTGVPRVFETDGRQRVIRHYYLGES